VHGQWIWNAKRILISRLGHIQLFGKETIMKIGRREHLRQLGLGAAGILGAGLFENDLSRITRANPRVLPRLKARGWPWTNTPPGDNPGIRMLFSGMMVFAYKGRQGRVVFHTTSANHKFEIKVFKRNPCTVIPMLEGTEIPAKIELINPPGHNDDVQYFQQGDPNNFDRNAWHENDFRWLLDLEGPEIYSNKNFRRTEDKGFNKKLHVRSGCFYTYLRTNSTFTSDVGSLNCPEFRIARIMACDIPLTGTESFVFKAGTKEIAMHNPSRYEIYFMNNCSSNCQPTGDFPMVFDAIEDEEQNYKFDLTLVKGRPGSPLGDVCNPLIIEGSDEAPCMGAAFGAGFGFP
jgi:hypothetical protein